MLLPRNLVQGGAKALIFNLIPEAWEQNDEIWENGKMYALAFSYDPLTHEALGLDDLSKCNGNQFASLLKL